jgi:glycosyltransferase involved in cell wall biosynthesis
MKLLFVGTNRGGGGTESHLITIVRAMADAGHDVAAAVWPDEFIHRALADHARVRLLPLCVVARNDVRAARELARLVRAERPDWLVGTFKREYWPVAVVGRLRRVPVVLFSHLDQRFHPTMRIGVPRLVRRLIAPTEYQRRRLVERGLPASKLVVLHNPVETAHFRPDPAVRAALRRRLDLADDDVLVGYVGRQEHGKGVMALADALDGAMTADPRVRMLWVGHAGDERTPLREVIAASPHAARHRWEPWAADVAPYFNAMDVAVLPSIGPETFGRVLAEAQACGVPVLGSALGGIPEALDDGVTGRLLPPGDAAAWAAAIGELAGDPGLRERMGRAGRAFVERRFASGRIAEQFEQILRSLAR